MQFGSMPLPHGDGVPNQVAGPCTMSGALPEHKGQGKRRRRRRHRSRSRERDVFEPYHACAVPRASALMAELPQTDRPMSTVMLRNIPCRYTQGSLMQEVDQMGFEGFYDFFYLPMDTRNKNSVGYAFINFKDSMDAERFVEVSMYCCSEPDKRDELQVSWEAREHASDEAAVGLPATARKAHTFKVVLKYDGRTLGADLDGTDIGRGLMVKAILEDGLLPDWNRSSPDKGLKPYDKIFEVNGKAGSVEELQERIVASGEELTLSVRRPEHRKISLERTASLGVKLHYKKSSRGVVINEILPEGLLQEWNDAHPSFQIAAGDRILEIGGVTQGAEDMTKRLSTDDKLDLTILHYDQETSYRK
ncbi:ML4 [Symbiodinium natans]|uniref:ML4 protein n=1 Tax=Symbiodinium natans TaxID=878477 RepID=A0A812NYA3_9DINO|nr:ML4 [Symbiodinium natans]